MNTITKQQLYTRWDTLSDILREAIASDANSQLVWKTGEKEHLSIEKISTVSKLTGYVLMGFIHPETLAEEITNGVGIDKRIASGVADSINTKIFQPIREELEKVYAPAGDEKETAPMPAPVSIDEIGKPQTAVPVPAPSAPVPPQTPKPKILVPVESAPAPKPVTQKGTLPQSMIPPKQPVKAVPPPNLPVLSGVEVPVSETPEIKSTEKVALPVQKESEAQPSAAPFILHQETESQPLAPTGTGFKVSLSEEQFGKMEQKWTPPPKAAQIETGSTSSPQAGFVPQPKPESPALSKVEGRVVHYSEMRTPVAPKPPAPSESLIPKPPVPPTGPSPEYKVGQPAQPRFPVSQPEQKMPSRPENPFGVSNGNNEIVNRLKPKP